MLTSFLSLYFLLSILQVGVGVSTAAGAAAPASSGAGNTGAASGVTAVPSSGAAASVGTGAQGVGTGTSIVGSSSSVLPATGSAGQPIATSGAPITLTLAQVVNTAVNNNTNVLLARQRLSEAAEGIKQVEALGVPQINGVLADTYSTFAESEADYSTLVTNPTLPGGSVIPAVVDEAADFPTSFGLGTLTGSTGSSGAGIVSATTGTSITLPASGSMTLPSPTSGSATTTALPASSTGASGAGTTTSAPGTIVTTPGTTSSSPGVTTTPGTTPSDSGSTGTSGSAGSMGATPSTSGTAFDLTPMPSILQNFVTETGAPEVVEESASDPFASSPTQVKTAVASDRQPAQSAGAEKSDTVSVADQGTGTGGSTTTGATSNIDESVIGKTAVNNYGARVNLSQYIDVFGILSAEKSAERLTTDFYATDVDRYENEVALSAKNLYFNVILAQQDVATDQEAVTDAQESARVTAALVQQGQAAGFDLLSAQTTLANDQQALTAAQDNYSFAIADLDYLLGLDPGTPIILTVPPLPPLNQNVNLQQSTLVALQRRPELMQANRNITLAQKLVKVATAGTTPTLGLVGEYGYNGIASVSGPMNEGLFSAQVGIPFDDGGATRSKVREAKVVLQSQVTMKNELRLNVELEVRQAYLNILEGQSSASTAQTAVALAEETLRVANVQYQNGVGTILDVENAQAQLATARTNLSNAQFTYETALASLVRAIGSR